MSCAGTFRFTDTLGLQGSVSNIERRRADSPCASYPEDWHNPEISSKLKLTGDITILIKQTAIWKQSSAEERRKGVLVSYGLFA